MGLCLGEGGGAGTSIEPVSAGVHPAVCYAVIDLGTHYNKMYDNRKREVLIQWEIPAERIMVERDGVKRDLPRAVSKRFTLSCNEKSNLRKMLESWRGKKFTPEEVAKFDISKLVSLGCQLNIMHEEKGDRVYANVSAVMPPPKGWETPVAENPLVFHRIGETVPASVPEWVRKIIAESDEVAGAPAVQKATPADCAVGDDSIPF